MTFNDAKGETVAKYQEIYKLINELETKHDDSCVFCQIYRRNASIFGIKCPANELCGCCEPMSRNKIYKEIGNTIELLDGLILNLIQKIADLEEPEE